LGYERDSADPSIGITLLLLLLLVCSLLRSGQGEVLRPWMEGPRVTSTAIPSRGGAGEEKKLMDGWCLDLDIICSLVTSLNELKL